ncbi:MAG: excisionase family DNA-binding protein [Syntrophomonas sp.]
MKQMWEAKTAATRLCISYWTLLKMAKEGQIPHVRIGRRVLFSEEAISAWIDEQETISIQTAKNHVYGTLRKINK